MGQVVGKIPDFTTDEAPAGETVKEEVKEAPVEETVVEEKETPEPPAEKPDENIVDDTKTPQQVVNPDELSRAVTGLQAERVKLLKEISELKGQRREIKQEALQKVEQQIDDLKDLHPDDVSIIDRVLRSKGYVTKEEANRMFYDSVKESELKKFLERYPEYKPENDPNDVNWSSLQREIGYYKIPNDPHQIAEILERAHRAVVKVPSGANVAPQQRRIQVASSGSGGVKAPSSSGKTLDPQRVAMLKQGGFTDEDIKKIESRL